VALLDAVRRRGGVVVCGVLAAICLGCAPDYDVGPALRPVSLARPAVMSVLAPWLPAPPSLNARSARARLALDDPLHMVIGTDIRLEFAGAVDPEAIERRFRIQPDVSGTFGWPSPTSLVFHPEALAYGTSYRVSVPGAPLGGFDLHTLGPPPQVPYPFTLTFDDCGSAEQIGAILTALADRGLHAIFFPTGRCRDQFPWLIPTLVAAGHRVCNHTYSHPMLTRYSAAAIRSEIERGVAVDCKLFRPPYGALNWQVTAIAQSLGYQVQMWDVDTRDWAGTSASDMVAMIRARGGVVLMHMHGRHTVEAIQQL
jgi:peptidoglycan/xylan/chitin deacetylase (PgdA/CDA1 family)